MIPKYPAHLGKTRERHEVTAYCATFKSIRRRNVSNQYLKKIVNIKHLHSKEFIFFVGLSTYIDRTHP